MAVFPGEGLFDATIHEIGDVGIFLGFGGAVLLESCIGHHLAEQFVEWLWREDDLDGKVLFYLSESHHIQGGNVVALERFKVGEAECLNDLAGTIGPEVENENTVAVLDDTVL